MGDHGLGVLLDLLALKRGLGESPLAPPERSFAGQETLADQGDQPPRQLVLDEIISMRTQDVINVIGVDKHIGCQVAEPERDDVAVFPHGRLQEADLVAQVGERVTQKQAPPGTGGHHLRAEQVLTASHLPFVR